MLKGYSTYKKWLWPLKDVKARREMVDGESWKDIDRVIPYVTGTRSVVQAGGNCGVWASRLTKWFSNIYTFEPDPVNFVALAVNTAPYHNVHRFQCALGDDPEHVVIARTHKDNIGNYRVGGTTPLNDGVPILKLDDLHLNEVDLILLDIEGYEAHALCGAHDTIQRCLPVVMMEDKGMDAKHHGLPRGAAVSYLERMGYEVKERVARDVIMVPGEKLAAGKWECPIGYPGCEENCGNYGCGN